MDWSFILKIEREVYNMKTFLLGTAILSLILAVGAIEDCGGHCMGQENWALFFIMTGIGLVSGLFGISLQDKQ